MRRRLTWGFTALVTVLAMPMPAHSETGPEASPKMHVAGIDSASDPGGPRSTEVPRLVRPGSDLRPTTAGSQGSPSGEIGGILAPTVLPPTFDGVPDLEILSPADPTGALGLTHHLAAVNVHMAFYDRAGIELDPPRRLRSLDDDLPAGVDDFDPKVVYDPYRQHFLLVFASASSTQSFLSLVVIPEGSEAVTADWCVLHMSGDQVASNGKQLADYPMLGFTENRVTLTTNQFDYSDAPFAGGFQYVQIISMRKTHLYDCMVSPVPIKVFSRTQTRDPDGSQAFTIVPTVSTGGAPTAQYMTSLDFNGATGKLILWRLKAVDGVLKLTKVSLGGGGMDYPPWGRQCGNTSGLNSKWDTGDLRLTSSFLDGALGRLYTTTAIRGNIGAGAVESVVRWWEVDPASVLTDSDVTRTGRVGASGRDAAWPSIATDGDGKVWVNYARAGVSECLAAYAGVIQPGATGAASVLIHGGDGRYEYSAGSVERWGDYTAISRDPLDPATMAAYGAYPIDDGVGGTATELWQQVIATLTDV
ncbi:MAG: hypothetical protein H0W97_03315 [Actinobacteria bacterium]|nr:hypothetical protein [Actinomycetota bacterium]